MWDVFGQWKLRIIECMREKKLWKAGLKKPWGGPNRDQRKLTRNKGKKRGQEVAVFLGGRGEGGHEGNGRREKYVASEKDTGREEFRKGSDCDMWLVLPVVWVTHSRFTVNLEVHVSPCFPWTVYCYGNIFLTTKKKKECNCAICTSKTSTQLKPIQVKYFLK